MISEGLSAFCLHHSSFMLSAGGAQEEEKRFSRKGRKVEGSLGGALTTKYAKGAKD
jgi:hypothetical protein